MASSSIAPRVPDFEGQERHRGSGTAVALLLMVVVVGLAAVRVLPASVADRSDDALDLAVQSALESPDLLLTGQPGDQNGSLAETIVHQRLGWIPAPHSAEHVVSVEGPDTFAAAAVIDVYRWQTTDGPDSRLRCVGWLEQHGTGSVCRPAAVRAEPDALWSSTEASNGTWHSALLYQLPDSAAQVVVLTASGRTTVSNVTDGVAYLTWPAHEGTPGGLIPRQTRDFGHGLTAVVVDGDGAELQRFDAG